MPLSKSQADFYKNWEDLLAPLAANATELPHLEVQRVKLQEILAAIRERVQQQAAFRARKQEASRELQELFRKGRSVAYAVRVTLLEQYGNRSEKLAEFRLQPFRGRPRQKPVAPEPEAPSPPPSTPDSAA